MRFDKARLSTGLRIHYAESGDARGTPVVFVHGWPDSWFSFSRVLPLLPATLRLVALDQRGFGESDHPDSGYTIAGFAADLVAFLDALDIDRSVLVGHSYGTFVARRAAIVAPERVAALALIGTGASTKIAGADDLQAALRELPNPIPEPFAREFQSGTVYRPVPAQFFDRIIEESLKIPPRLWPVMIDGLLAYDDTRELGRIRAPTLLLWGDHDALFSRAQQDAFLAALPAARLKVYQETGHCPNWERPEWVAADIADFVASATRGLRREASTGIGRAGIDRRGRVRSASQAGGSRTDVIRGIVEARRLDAREQAEVRLGSNGDAL
jgi:pimeloyl-ACP methyl ester carboxylesterase